ncbi:metallophosphoesterase [Globicatella sulfidifaciens]|uniref:Metallophosphoesterase n=1 Tax=Globicatella sulfidifaciens TaxID=136093 RepID=A0A7X8H104_9LACT|nr:metallophosphoesterase [Globicatella sulfidifaciens]NLJ19389.1 metallophosphoesterase [Globicatella sulfidifaciens]
MIYITGDTHRDFERVMDFCDEVGTSQEEDIMIILGDAMINYYLDANDTWLKEELSEYPITFFFIHGNHEERPYMIDSYEEDDWNGGIIYVEKEYPHLIFAKDGEIYDFDGRKAMAIGGAYSVDRFSRDVWFDTEQPDEIIKTYVEQQLDKIDWKIDYIFSHTAPYKYEPREEYLPNINQEYIDKSTEQWLDEIEDKLDYERWYLGHYHCDKRIDRVTIMYMEFEEL